ncbi:PhaM family polyhydroxyalkanoate granule multifunctional regulatory protein [Cupriavidus metallidurans]|uniref:PhaM family polyhydroxyalkanoate granule multifunctional regulatory protein n=1 Tax=Cupriavidus metallidurans TaxID=119219 RepID=UPI000562FC18|nr:PhaM family polyhydroxyalkanoate granule multifunctional regulatory protein [Cupriavidus metallidurans]
MFGQLPDFTNSYEFLRKLWASGSGMPSGLMPGLSAMTPPMDLEGIDKRIHDLKAVESWLQLNSSLLRTTIQGLEVQRATLVALQTFGSALSPDAMQSAMENVARAASAPSAAPHHEYGTGKTVSEAQADAENDEPADDDIDAPPESGPEAGAEASATSTGPAPVPPNASLWWDLMQQQFNQIASSAAAAANATPFSNLGGFGASPAGSESATSTKSATSAGDNKSGPTPKGAKTSGTKKAGTKTVARKSAKSATKPAAKTSGKSSAKKPAARNAPAGKSTAKPQTPPAPGTPEDTFE